MLRRLLGARRTRFTFSWPTAKADEMGSAQLTGVMRIVDRDQARLNGTDFDEEAYSRDMDGYRPSLTPAYVILRSHIFQFWFCFWRW